MCAVLSLYAGLSGIFGASTPERLPLNPMAESIYWTVTNGAYYPFNGICRGADFTRNAKIKVRLSAILSCTNDIVGVDMF